MNVFAKKYLEDFSSEIITDVEKWNWKPSNPKIAEIYASGHKTKSKQSTYANERDNNSDTDRPNEGD